MGGTQRGGLEGQQVVDMALFKTANPRERLSTSNSRIRYVPRPGAEYVPRDKLMEGDTHMSTLCRPMMTFVKETPEPKAVGLSSCPLDVLMPCNAYHCTPVRVDVYAPE